MIRLPSSIAVRLGILVAAGLTGLLSGCDDSRFDRDPPEGMGTLVMDNYTGDRLLVYIDGLECDSTSAGDYRYYDLVPGVHRVVLDGDDTDRAWAGDVDILEGRRTVLEVRTQYLQSDNYEIELYLD